MKAFLINLDKSIDRLRMASEQLGKLGIEFQRFPAIYGKYLTKSELRQHFARFHSRMARLNSFTLGEIGCALSHTFVLKKMIDENIPVALVFEDDIELLPKFPCAIKTVESFLDINKPQVYLFSESSNAHVDETGNESFSVCKIRSALRAEAYVITLPAARNIFRVNYPIVTMNDIWGRWVRRGLIELYRITPPTCRQNQETLISTVTPNKREKLSGLKWIVWKLVRLPCYIIDEIWWLILRR